MTERCYPPPTESELAAISVGGLYQKHVNAMTVEDLHSKASIAEQLALRDLKIEQLQAQLKARGNAHKTQPVFVQGLVSCAEMLESTEAELAKATLAIDLLRKEAPAADARLTELLKQAKEAVDRMTPEERSAMYAEQRLSWARGQAGLIDSDREYSRSRGLDGD